MMPMFENLTVGQRYEFSTYVANIFRKSQTSSKPRVTFEIRDANDPKKLLTRLVTQKIPECDKMTWSKYGLSFIASTSSVRFLMISNVDGGRGNDIELRVCSPINLPQKSAITTITTMHGDPLAYIGSYCNVSNTACHLLEPCQNGGICNNTIHGYTCSCPVMFSGRRCEFKRILPISYSCSNHGKYMASNKSSPCLCNAGWQGQYCESMINFCHRITCMNNGICQPSLLNYTCHCLDGIYSGRHCEVTAKKILTARFLSKLIAYISMTLIFSPLMFIVIMNV